MLFLEIQRLESARKRNLVKFEESQRAYWLSQGKSKQEVDQLVLEDVRVASGKLEVLFQKIKTLGEILSLLREKDPNMPFLQNLKLDNLPSLRAVSLEKLIELKETLTRSQSHQEIQETIESLSRILGISQNTPLSPRP